MIMLATGSIPRRSRTWRITFKDVPPVFGSLRVSLRLHRRAATLGIVNGYADGTFGPTRAITRAHLVLMVVEEPPPRADPTRVRGK